MLCRASFVSRLELRCAPRRGTATSGHDVLVAESCRTGRARPRQPSPAGFSPLLSQSAALSFQTTPRAASSASNGGRQLACRGVGVRRMVRGEVVQLTGQSVPLPHEDFGRTDSQTSQIKLHALGSRTRSELVRLSKRLNARVDLEGASALCRPASGLRPAAALPKLERSSLARFSIQNTSPQGFAAPKSAEPLITAHRDRHAHARLEVVGNESKFAGYDSCRSL